MDHSPRHWSLRGIAGLFLCVAASLVGRESAAQVPATYPGLLICPSTAPVEVPVYFQAGDLAVYGYDVSRFRNAVVRSVNVWNEESRTGRRFRYAGDLTGSQPPGTVLVTHGDHVTQPGPCVCRGGPTADTSLAYAGIIATEPGCDPSQTGQICVRMRRCNSTQIPWNEGIANASEYSYEAVMIHELGHSGFGFPDVNSDWGVMRSNAVPGPVATDLHLYPIDQRSASVAIHLPESRRATMVEYDWGSYSWSSVYNQSTGIFSSVAPAVAEYRAGPARPYVAVSTLITAPMTPTAAGYQPSPLVLAGQPSGPWATSTTYPPTSSPYPYAIPTLGTRVAVSDFGEVMATWVSCTDNSLYPKQRHCGCSFAYSDTPSTSGQPSWIIGHVRTTTGTFDEDEGRLTYAPCAVAYSRRNDHFVIAYLSAPGMNPFTAFTHALRSQFNLTLAADARAGAGSWPLRYIGNLAFARTSTTSSFGILTAAAAPSYGSGRVLDIVSMEVLWNGSRYVTLEPVEAASQSEEPYRTTRHFGTVMLGSVDAAVMFWPDVTASGGTLVGTVRGATAWPYNAPFALEPSTLTPPAPTLTSSVNAGMNYDYSDGHIMISFSRE